jgi:hypothetical protein
VPVRPAQAAAGHRPEAQVHAFHVRGPDEDLTERLGRRQVGHFAAGDLEGDIRLALVVVGALHRLDEQGDPAQRPVVIEAGHFLQRLDDVGEDRLGRLGARRHVQARVRVELGVEQLQDQAGDLGVVPNRFLLHRLAGVQARLLAPAGEGAHQRRLAPVDAELDHQTVEAVALGLAAEHRQEGVLERLLHIGEDEVGAARILDQELVHIDAGPVGGLDLEAVLDDRLEPHVVEHR